MTFAALYALLAAAYLARYTGPAGRDRFMRLGDDRARALRAQVTSSWTRWALGILLVHNTLHATLGLDRAAWLDAAGATAGVGACVVGLVLVPRARVTVDTAAADRDLPPEPGADTSARRSRRLRQINRVLAGGFLVAILAANVTELSDSDAAAIVAGAGLLTSVVALVAAGWASVWIYGDEQPAEPTTRRP